MNFSGVILAGIDEAGYGPVLGPLVAALAALEFGDDAPFDAPQDGWTALSPAVARGPGSHGHLAVCDSKLLYRGARKRGLADLETTALSFSTWQHGTLPRTASEFLARHAGPSDAPIAEYPWYGGSSELSLPLAASKDAVLAHASRLAHVASGAGVRVHRLLVRPALEDEFNTRSEAFGSKARLLFDLNVDLLLRCRDARLPLRVVCDRHGGRSRYRDLLATAFPLEPVASLEEGDSGSSYRVGGGATSLELLYTTRGEEVSFATALASIFAKYTREMFMEAFNRFFLARTQDVRKTAGYYTDGMRFVADLEKAGAVTDVERQRMIRRR